MDRQTTYPSDATAQATYPNDAVEMAPPLAETTSAQLEEMDVVLTVIFDHVARLRKRLQPVTFDMVCEATSPDRTDAERPLPLVPSRIRGHVGIARSIAVDLELLLDLLAV